MKRKMDALRFLLLCFLILTCTTTFAAIHHSNNGYKVETSLHTPGYFEIIAAGSVSNVDADDGEINVTNIETDTLEQTNGDPWNSWGGSWV